MRREQIECVFRMGRVMRVGAGLGVAVTLSLSGISAESEEEDPGLPISESGMSSVAEDELAPALESNRQPLGPDPLVWPQWTADEAAAFDAGRPVNLGGGLWTAERYPLQPVPPWPEVPPARPPVTPGVLGWNLLSQFGAAREWCVDPQEVMDAERRRRLADHLTAHARTARHPVRLWLLAPGQSLAEALDETTLHLASFGPNQPGVLAVVALDQPMAARMILPPALAAQAPAWRAAVMAEVDATASIADQLDQLTLWLTLEAEPLPAVESVASNPVLLPASTSLPAKEPAFLSGKGWAALVASLVAVAGFLWFRRRQSMPVAIASDPAVWLEIERPMRLGGPHSGGSGAVIGW